MAERVSDTPDGDATERLPIRGPREPSGPKLLGSTSFFRLWLAQVVSSLGDWIGLFAILTLTARIGKGSPEAAIALVMSARMIPGFFLASVGGVLVDRWDRRKVMVSCDVGRGLVLATLPFVDSVWQLFLASLVLEVLTLLWSPAKEASVPNLVPSEKLASANSFSLAAAYGTFPIASALFASLTKVSEIIAAKSYVNTDVNVIEGRMRGEYDNGIGKKWKDANYMKFYNDGLVNFPFLSDGMWFLSQHRRWGLLKEDPDYMTVAKQVNQIELYKQAATQVKVPLPKEPTRTAKFFDGVVWDGKDAKQYAGSFKVRV